MRNLIRKALAASKQYTLFDFAGLKITLILLGILIGAYFAPFFLKNTLSLWIIFIIAYAYIMYRTFVKHWNK